MGVYNPQQLGINANTTGGQFQQGAWYNGRQYWNGTLSDPGVIHPESNQIGAGKEVSAEVNAQSAQAQNVSPQNFNNYLEEQRKIQQQKQVQAEKDYYAGVGGSMPGVAGQQGGAGGGAGFTAPSTINLPDIYQKLYETSAIKSTQEASDKLSQEMLARETALNDAKMKINDNPFYSEATRTGRLAKLDEAYNADVQTLVKKQQVLQDKIATEKADIETKLNIEMKQFDINSQQAQLALSQFNTLLEMGALDGASGEDIANITRSTGISSQMIYSAIQTQKQRNIQTSTISFDDGTNQGFAIINSQTGEIISKQNVARSKPAAAKEPSESDKKEYYMNSLRSDAQKGLTLSQIFALYTGYVEPDTIYQLYNANSKYGPDPGTNISKLSGYGVTQPSLQQQLAN